MADVFISYSSADRDRVRPLAEALETKGFSVWWDRALAAGDEYAGVIARELAAAKAVIVVWSKNANESPWVRDEAARARNAGRLVPVMLDPGEPPLGFGQIHTEDFTAWNGQKNAAQVQLLAEVLRAKVEGRAIDPGVVAAKRKRLMRRVRLVSVLGVIALVVAIAAGISVINANRRAAIEAQAGPAAGDQLSQLLRLVEEGKITGEQAVELAKLLENQAFADVPAPQQSADAGALAESAPSAGATRSLDDRPNAGVAMERSLATPAPVVSDADARAAAQGAFYSATAQLLQDPDPRVREAVVQASAPATREQGLNALWELAKEDGASAAAIYRMCGALMHAVGDSRAPLALERARALNPQDKALWRLLSNAYQRSENYDAAAAAALVGQGLELAAAGEREAAAETLQRALPMVGEESRGFVLGQLGDAAAARGDWAAAERSYQLAVTLHGRRGDAGALSVDASKLARAQLEQGDADEACATLREAAAGGASVSEAEMAEACAEDASPTPSLRERITAPIRERSAQP